MEALPRAVDRLWTIPTDLRHAAERGVAAITLVGRLLEDDRMSTDPAKRVMTRVDAEPHLPVPLREAAVAATQRVLAELNG